MEKTTIQSSLSINLTGIKIAKSKPMNLICWTKILTTLVTTNALIKISKINGTWMLRILIEEQHLTLIWVSSTFLSKWKISLRVLWMSEENYLPRPRMLIQLSCRDQMCLRSKICETLSKRGSIILKNLKIDHKISKWELMISLIKLNLYPILTIYQNSHPK